MLQLKDAAMEGDEAALEERIDFPAIRTSLKEELKAKMAAEMVGDQGNGMEKFGAVLAMGMIDPIIDGFITPSSIGQMIREGKMKNPNAEQDAEAGDVDWDIERGLSTFRATPQTNNGSPAPTLVFERDFLSWRLAKIEMPEGALGQ